MLIGLGSMFWVALQLRSASVEINARVENPREKYLVSNFMRIVREILTGLTLLLIGVLMKQGISG